MSTRSQPNGLRPLEAIKLSLLMEHCNFVLLDRSINIDSIIVVKACNFPDQLKSGSEKYTFVPFTFYSRSESGAAYILAPHKGLIVPLFRMLLAYPAFIQL